MQDEDNNGSVALIGDQELIDQQILSDLLIISQKHHKHVLTKISKVCFAALGLISGIPYIKRAAEYAGDNEGLRGLYIYSILVSLGALTTWAFVDITENASHPFIRYTAGPVVVSAIIGCLSAIPITIISITYGEPIASVLLAFFSDAIGNAFPINNGIRNIARYYRNRHYKMREARRACLIKMIRKIQILLVKDDIEDAYNFLERSGLLNIINQSAGHLDLVTLCRGFNRYAKGNIVVIASESITKKIVSHMLGLALALGWLPTGFKVVYKESIKLVGSVGFGIIMSLSSTIPVCILEYSLAQELIIKLLHKMPCDFIKRTNKTFSQVYYPTAFYLLATVGIVTTFFSWTPRAVVVEENQDGIYESIAVPWVAMSVIFFKSSAMLNLIPFVILLIAAYMGSHKQSAISHALTYLDRLVTYIQELKNLDKLERLFELFNRITGTYEEGDEELNVDYSVNQGGLFSIAGVTPSPILDIGGYSIS